MSEKCAISLNDKLLNLDSARNDILAIAMLVDNPVSVSVATRMTTLSEGKRVPNKARVDFVTGFASKGNPDDVFTCVYKGSVKGKEKVTTVKMTRSSIAERLLIASRFEEFKALSRETTIEGKVTTSEDTSSQDDNLSLDDLA